MMKNMKRWLAAARAVMLCLSLAACKGKDFDAKGYVKSVLDAHYHGEYKDYAKYLDISEEEAKADLDKDVDQQIDQEVAAIIDLGDEGKARYKEMLEKVEKLAKYEVKDAKKQDNGNYVVTVEVEPSNIYQTLEQNSTSVTEEKVNQGLMPSDPAVFTDILVESIQKSIDGNTYGDATTVEVNVTKDDNGAYGLEESEVQKLADALFPQ